MEVMILTPRFEEDYDKKVIEFVDNQNKIVCTGYFVPYQFVIHPYIEDISTYDSTRDSISAYSYSVDEMTIMGINTTYTDNIHSFRKHILYGMIQDAIHNYQLSAYKEGIYVIIENGYANDAEILETSALYRYVRYYYSTLLSRIGDRSNPTVYRTKNFNEEEKKSVKRTKMELIKNKEYIDEDPVHNEEPEDGNPAYRKADDPDKELNYIYD